MLSRRQNDKIRRGDQNYATNPKGFRINQSCDHQHQGMWKTTWYASQWKLVLFCDVKLNFHDHPRLAKDHVSDHALHVHANHEAFLLLVNSSVTPALFGLCLTYSRSIPSTHHHHYRPLSHLIHWRQLSSRHSGHDGGKVCMGGPPPGVEFQWSGCKWWCHESSTVLLYEVLGRSPVGRMFKGRSRWRGIRWISVKNLENGQPSQTRLVSRS